jgi:hypothetical protein
MVAAIQRPEEHTLRNRANSPFFAILRRECGCFLMVEIFGDVFALLHQSAKGMIRAAEE